MDLSTFSKTISTQLCISLLNSHHSPDMKGANSRQGCGTGLLAGTGLLVNLKSRVTDQRESLNFTQVRKKSRERKVEHRDMLKSGIIGSQVWSRMETSVSLAS